MSTFSRGHNDCAERKNSVEQAALQILFFFSSPFSFEAKYERRGDERKSIEGLLV